MPLAAHSAHQLPIAMLPAVRSLPPASIFAAGRGHCRHRRLAGRFASQCGLAICLRLAPRTSAEHRFLSGPRPLPLSSVSRCSHSSQVPQPSAVAGASSAPSGLATGPWLSLDARWSLADRRALGCRIAFPRRRSRPSFLPPAQAVEAGHSSRSGEPPQYRACAGCDRSPRARSGLHHDNAAAPQRDWFLQAAHPDSRLALRPPHSGRAGTDRAPRGRTSAPARRLDQSLPEAVPGSLPAQSRAGLDRAPPLPRARDGLRRRRRQNYACAARLCRLPRQSCRARSSSAAPRRFRWAPGSAAPSWSTAFTAFCAASTRWVPWGRAPCWALLGCGLLFGSIELARCPQLVAFVPARNQDRIRMR